MRSNRRRGGPEREHVLRRRRASRHPEHNAIGSLFYLLFDGLLFLPISSWS